MTGLENPLNLPNPTSWMPTYIWNKLCQYAEADGMFDLLVRRFKNEEKKWKELFDCENLSEDLFPQMSAGLMWPEF